MKRRSIGGSNAQTRRRARRAAQRRETHGLSDHDIRDIQGFVTEAVEELSLTAAASGSTDLPLSDQNAAWDSGAAAKTLDTADFPKAYFWKDPDGDATKKSSFKLPFATKASGTLTAVWKGVTSAAGAIQGARGGVQIPSGDIGGVKSRIAGYYADAAKKYDDDSIKVPWAPDAKESAVRIMEQFGFQTVELDDVAVSAALLAYAETGPEPDIDAYCDRYEEIMAEILGGDPPEQFANYEAARAARRAWREAVELGGKPSQGTKKDKRLKDNKQGGTDDADAPPEEHVLDAIDAWQAAVKCACGHAFSEHTGGGGTCGHEDGRGTCSCAEFSFPDSDVAALARAIVQVRPDLEGHEAQIMRVAERTLLALTSAAGDLVWGPEEGFMDLLCDVNQLLHPGDDESWFDGPWAADASVKLDKVLICDGGEYFVAPITIDGTGEPVLSDKTDWIAVEDAGYVETNDKMKLREAIVGGKFTLLAAPVAEMPQAEEVLPDESDEIVPPEAAPSDGSIPWHATFIPEGKLTEDGRAFAPGSTLIPGEDEGARELPLTLMAMIETSAEGGHDGAKVAGRIDDLYREAPDIEADGVFSNEEFGAMIARMVENKELTGLSVDIAPLEYDWVPQEQYFSDSGDFIGVWDDEAGEWAPAPGTEHLSEDEDDDPLARFFGEDDRVLLITKAVIGMATVCPFPAFGGASIGLTAAGMPNQVIVPLQMEMPAEALTAAGIPLCEECRESQIEVLSEGRADSTQVVSLSSHPKPDEPVLTAAAAGLAPLKPPASWFADPELEALTPLTITDDGRIYGHAWAWESCHLSFDRCVTAPHSEAEYGYFLFGEIECEDGARLNVGKITYDTSHAGVRLSRLDAVKHYDNTGTVAAHVQFGEDEFGGWFAGALCPDMPEEDIRTLRASAISGDWRGIDGNLELVALLAVNLGGFPVPRGAVEAVGEDVEPLALVAAGVVTDARIAEIQRLAAEVIETGGALVPQILTDQIVSEIEALTATPDRLLDRLAE